VTTSSQWAVHQPLPSLAREAVDLAKFIDAHGGRLNAFRRLPGHSFFEYAGRAGLRTKPELAWTQSASGKNGPPSA
jgi:hypothetical protein